MTLGWLLLAACASSPEGTPPGQLEALAHEGGVALESFARDLPEGAARACLHEHCRSADDLQACFQRTCPQREPRWDLVLEQVEWAPADRVFFVRAHVAYEPGAWGPVEALREAPVFVGVTLVTPEGKPIDLAIQSRFSGNFEEPFFISAEVGEPVRDFLMGVWDRKIQPCDSERPGCRKFGFLLDGPLASWPPGLYDHLQMQRLPPDVYAVEVVNGGVPPARAQALAEGARDTLAALLEPFGTRVTLEGARLADAAREADSEVWCGDPHDLPLARQVAGALSEGTENTGSDGDWTFSAPPEASGTEGFADRFELRVAGDPTVHACLVEHCAPATDRGACFREHCR